jgi:hypothetical protein
MKVDSFKEKNIQKRVNNKLKNFIEKSKENNYMFISMSGDSITLTDPNGDIFTENKNFLYQRQNNDIVLSTNILRKNGTNSSNFEYEIVDFLNSNNIFNIVRNKKLLNNKEIDIFLPDYNVGIEFNGLYWHSELFVNKNYHLEKLIESEKKGISLIQIFEDEWINKKEIVKSIILNKLMINKEIIYARKTSIIKLDYNIEKEFLNKNHIQGFVNSKYSYGLLYNGQLVSVMSFSSNRRSLGSVKKENEYELLRFSNKLNTIVIGGASKLFNFFLKEIKPIKVISYSDKRYFNGKIYETLNMDFIGNTKINYWYIKGKNRYHRFKFRKDVLVKNGYDQTKTERQIMMENKYYRIYDCGNKKFEYINK